MVDFKFAQRRHNYGVYIIIDVAGKIWQEQRAIAK
jgi:hypothetical protein